MTTPESSENLTRALELIPKITSVRDAKGVEIPNGAITKDKTVTLFGTAMEKQSVDIFDGTTSKGVATADSNGEWALTVMGLSVGNHICTARARYGNGQVSAARTFTVTS
ncbi:hypothetical protein HCU66_15100 [Pseudomonas frederiksbergensis]|uniref:Ig-like domain-containing protein n=1 Tax=Pseudomonas frederiksbergensis TaxID=104087 RepID=UPI00197D635C|nr:Ig-like domain-containing protein [Pseudomonas frederiksbergensis]MBN3863563.1 hypothetical protein [Pseudomonas frederiksbergensis]